MENRKDPRIHIHMRTHFVLKSRIGGGEGHVRDLSVSGCRVTHDIPLPVGTELELTFLADDYKDPLIINRATVCWEKNGEYGIQFNELRGDAKKRISFLCRRIIV